MGNRVKGKPKRKSIKAASHSRMGSKRKLSRMGKKQKKDHAGLDATFIGRSSCLRRLQLSLKDFRRLCILKGVYPREPRGRAPKNRKGQVYYHINDIRAIAHEPVLDKFREFKAYMKKVRRAAGRNEKDEAARKHALAPTYTLHHLVRERYPRFTDALGDIDDALTLVYLFAALPSEGDIRFKVTSKAKTLAAAWGAYCATTSAITKSFISVKGIYLEASIQNCTIRWVSPHSFTQMMPEEVDYKVMLTFFEFYETLLSFVLFKLYSDLGLRYPLPVKDTGGELQGSTSAVLGTNLKALHAAMVSSEGAVSNVVADTVQKGDANDDTNGTTTTTTKKSRQLIKTVGSALKQLDDDDDNEEDEDDDDDGVDVAGPLKAALETIAEEEERAALPGLSGHAAALGEDATKRRRLFAGLTFFLSREVPRGYLELVCLAYGAKVGWDGKDSPLLAKDPSITHHIVDRPRLPASFKSLPKSREFIQPQWILDSTNFHFLLPVSKYAVGATLPPHLSPWVDDEEEGYKPAYAEEIEKLKNGETMDVDDEEEEKVDGAHEDDKEESMVSKKEEEEKTEEVDEEEEEDENDTQDETEEEEEEEEEEKAKETAKPSKKQKRSKDNEKETEEHKLARVMMSKKASRLYGRMQHGIAQKVLKAESLQKRRKEIESSKEKGDGGKSMLRQKVDRLRKERKSIEKDYSGTGGSMKKNKNKKNQKKKRKVGVE